MFYDTFNSPLGPLTVSTNGAQISGLHITGDRYFTGIPSGWVRSPDQPLLRQARRELSEYFAGQRQSFTLPVLLFGTSFQKQVWQALQQIPQGSTSTYAAIAQSIGKPRAVRAVGTAIGHNPVCIIVPCHRVLASDGSLGGYVAGLKRKSQLLTLEQATKQP